MLYDASHESMKSVAGKSRYPGGMWMASCPFRPNIPGPGTRNADCGRRSIRNGGDELAFATFQAKADHRHNWVM
jgi:hypothetical protein